MADTKKPRSDQSRLIGSGALPFPQGSFTVPSPADLWRTLMAEGDGEAELVAATVDTHPWGQTEDDEEQILRELYGQPDPGGIYRGQPS